MCIFSARRTCRLIWPGYNIFIPSRALWIKKVNFILNYDISLTSVAFVQALWTRSLFRSSIVHSLFAYLRSLEFTPVVQTNRFSKAMLTTLYRFLFITLSTHHPRNRLQVSLGCGWKGLATTFQEIDPVSARSHQSLRTALLHFFFYPTMLQFRRKCMN